MSNQSLGLILGACVGIAFLVITNMHSIPFFSERKKAETSKTTDVTNARKS